MLLSPTFPPFFPIWNSFYSLIAILYTKIILGDIIFFSGARTSVTVYLGESYWGERCPIATGWGLGGKQRKTFTKSAFWKGCPCFYRNHLGLFYNTTLMSLRKILVLVLVYFFPFNNSFKLDNPTPLAERFFEIFFLTKQTSKKNSGVPFLAYKELSPNILYS